MSERNENSRQERDEYNGRENRTITKTKQTEKGDGDGGNDSSKGGKKGDAKHTHTKDKPSKTKKLQQNGRQLR